MLNPPSPVSDIIYSQALHISAESGCRIYGYVINFTAYTTPAEKDGNRGNEIRKK